MPTDREFVCLILAVHRQATAFAVSIGAVELYFARGQVVLFCSFLRCVQGLRALDPSR
jgi:hypothetical protein